MTIQEHIDLKEFTSFKIGGPARYFAVVRTADDVYQALQWARDRKSRTCILGGGSNVLFSDTGFDGLVVKMQLLNLSVNGTLITAGASVLLADLITKTLAQGITGLEFAAGIPGELGGAIRGNAGTFGIGMGDVVRTVTVIDGETLEKKEYSAPECGFAYRQSVFKERSDVILEAQLSLTCKSVEESKKIIDERIQTRQQQHPSEPSAGCIFKNIELSKVDQGDLKQRGIDTSLFQKYQKIPTGYLIEQLGLKGKSIGGAMISERHANYIINAGAATYEDIVTMISFIKQQVRDAYGIQLEEEVQIVQ